MILLRTKHMVIGMASLALTIISLGISAAPVAQAAPWGSSCLTSHLYGGSYGNISYAPGGFCSINGNAKTIFQSDGNLVTYVNGRATWSSRTNGLNATRFVLQSDGNLVIYRVDTPVWNSHTNGQVGAMNNAIQQLPDGQFNAYKVNSTNNLTQIW